MGTIGTPAGQEALRRSREKIGRVVVALKSDANDPGPSGRERCTVDYVARHLIDAHVIADHCFHRAMLDATRPAIPGGAQSAPSQTDRAE